MKKWIYQIRGLAIIAVVMCHQQGTLHNTEILQLLSLYSVTTLVFLMGVTKSLSIKKYYSAHPQNESVLAYSLRSIYPVLCTYFFATLWISYVEVKGDYNTLLAKLLSFSASSPFYFIKYYILLSLWAPILFSIIKWALNKYCKRIYTISLLVIIFAMIFGGGYLSIGKVDIFGQSYLFVYSAGLFVGQLVGYNVKKIYLVPSFIMLLFGLISTKNFYWARVRGIYDYSEGIDFFAPKLQMNPPNISIIIYSFGVISVSWFLFTMINKGTAIYLKAIGSFFCVLGKYSLDIFLWHMYICQWLNRYFYDMNKNGLKWGIYYTSMFGLPIIVRYTYNKLKREMYKILGDAV